MKLNLDYQGSYAKCKSKQACIQPTYRMEVDRGIDMVNPKITFHMADPIVEYNIDFISYDLQSLVGEIGGTLGLTLGLSIYSLIDLIEYLEKVANKYF